MKIWQEIPKRGYVSQPTPLEELVRFSEKAGVRVRIKRDDLLPLGGNKIRKLDYLMEEAVRAGADTIITASTNQCCHNSMTVLLAAREGMACRVIMESWGDTRYRYETASNHTMIEFCGPEEVSVETSLPSGPVEAMPEAMDGVRFDSPVKAVDEIHFLTVSEQKAFLEAAKHSHNYNQYALILETGLRTGEVIGLTWDAIDWDKRTLTVNKTMEFRHKQHEWRAGPPKTKTSYRTIPLTDTAYQILWNLYLGREYRKESPELDKVLTYIDRRTAKQATLRMRDLVFINYRTGMPAKNSSYDTHLYKLCDKAGLEHFCMHALRHTYATRAIESGMQPKVLQKLLGHASIKTTMDRYVHVTDDTMFQAVRQFQNARTA